jgi:hypothetical protein
MHGFLECIEFAWHKEVAANQNPLVVLHIKLSRVAKALRVWSKTLIPQGKLALVISREIILQLEKAQETRTLTQPERSLIKHLKRRILGLAAVEKSRAR